jgi:hypothetical protein
MRRLSRPVKARKVPSGLITVADRTVAEGGGTVTVTIQLAWAQDQALRFDYRTADGTAIAGSDYTAVSGTATISVGSTSTTVDITILDDAILEDDEAFTFYVSNPRYV